MPNFYYKADRYTNCSRRTLSASEIGTVYQEITDVSNNCKNSKVHLSCTTGGNSIFNRNSTASVLTSTPMDVSNGFSTVFSLDDVTGFGGIDGYDGIVSFAWTAYPFNFIYDAPIPAHLDYANRTPTILGDEDPRILGGGLAPNLWEYDNVGFTLTLFPDCSNVSKPCRVGSYRLCVRKMLSQNAESTDPTIIETDKNVIIYEDDLPNSVDLSEITSLAFSKDKLGYINIFLNGVSIVSFYVSPECDLSNHNSLLFSMCVMAGFDGKVGFDMYSLGNAGAAFYNTKVGRIENLISILTARENLATDDDYICEIVEGILDWYSMCSDEEKQCLSHNEGIISALNNWYDSF